MFFTILGWVGLFLGGFLLGVFIILLAKVRKTKKVIFTNVQKNKSVVGKDSKKIKEIVSKKRKIYKKKNRFHVLKTVVGLKSKTTGYFTMYGEIINEVAKLQNPESQNPFLEFTIKQAFDFIDGVTIDLEEILNTLDLPMLKNIDISTIYGFIDLSNKINQIKFVKTAKKISKPIVKILRFLNPVKWLSLFITTIFTASLTRDLIFVLADIVAFEFSEFYVQCKNENVLIMAN